MRKKKMRWISCIISLAMIIGLVPIGNIDVQAKTAEKTEGREVLNMNQSWGFYRGDLEGAWKVDFDDSSFANVTVPHTMRLEKKHCNGGNATYKGIGWYRRYFSAEESWKGKKVSLNFEGVMTESDIYLNGEKIYTRNGGYMGFAVDITDKIKWDTTNVLAIRVSSADNPDTPPGKPDASLDFHYYGGIYRDVTMTITDPIHITDALKEDKVASGGILVSYENVSKSSADIQVKTHVRNEADKDASLTVVQTLKDKQGKTVLENEKKQELKAGDDVQTVQTMKVDDPKLWNTDNPYLYSLVTGVYEEGKLLDEVTTKIGIRTIAYKSDGFYLNGEHVYLRGANRHQSYQNIGDAAPNSMQYRDALQMKENGFNAVRATHYPQDPAFLDACDELGLLVIECQPGWQNFTNTDTFYQRTVRDTKEMIRRDRNRPSVILWETSLNETGYSETWAKEVTEAAHAEYPGDQLFTAADYGYHGQLYDVCYKVQDTQWKDDPSEWVDYDSNKPFLTREWGDFEGDSKAIRKDGEKALNTQTSTRQRYLNGKGYSDWGGLDASDRIGGYFLWSWNDYTRGSTTFTLGSGTVDIDRYEKNGYYWFQSMQPADNKVYGPMVRVSSYYDENSDLTIPVYSNCDSVKLYQNGTLVKEITKSEAGKAVPNIIKKGGSPIYEFSLKEFKVGELKAEGIVDGKVVCTDTVRTPEKETKIEIEVRDRDVKPIADGSDLIPVYIKAVDENGTVVPDYKGTVTLNVSGEGELVGENIPRIKVQNQTLEGGIGFAFVRTGTTAGDITITAEAEGLETGSATVTTKESEDKFLKDGTHNAWENGEDALEEESTEYKNIATGKPIEVSSEQSENKNYGTNVNDNDENTRWCASGGSFPQWIEIDLKRAYAINGFQIMWENASDIYQYTIEVSKDKENWTTVVEQSNRTEPNGTLETQLQKAEGRFVRLNIKNAKLGWASLYEFRVIPDEEKEDVNPGEIIPDEAIEKIEASAESVEGRSTDKLRDGITEIGSGWLSTSKKLPQTITVTFKEPQTLLGSRIYWEKDSSWYTYDMEVTQDGKTWTPVWEDYRVGGQHFKPETFEEIQHDVKAVRVEIKKIEAGGTYQVGMAEWILYGSKYEPSGPEPEKEYEYVSDLEWTSAHSDFGNVTKDQAAYGGKLVLNTADGEKEFSKGLGADTNSEIVYNVEGQNFEKFETYIGINARASKQGGEAIFKVYLDGKEKYVSPVKMRDDVCDLVSLDIKGAKEIKLQAIWNENPDNPEARYNTHVDWADAKFYYGKKETDKTELSQAIEVADKIAENKDSYTKKSYEAFEKALNKAKEVLENQDATQKEVNDAKVALLDAQNKLVEKADVTALKDAIEKAETIKEEDVTPSSWDRVQAAKKAAEDVLKAFEKDDESVTQEQIDSATKALNDAIDSAQKRADFSKLQEAVNRIEKLDLDGYTKDSVKTLKEALKEAKAVLKNEEATQKEVEDALTKLLAAEAGLVKEDEKPNPDPNPGDPGNPGNSGNSGNTDKPDNSGKPSGGNHKPVKTGDASPVAETGMLMLAAATVLLVWRKRNR